MASPRDEQQGFFANQPLALLLRRSLSIVVQAPRAAAIVGHIAADGQVHEQLAVRNSRLAGEGSHPCRDPSSITPPHAASLAHAGCSATTHGPPTHLPGIRVLVVGPRDASTPTSSSISSPPASPLYDDSARRSYSRFIATAETAAQRLAAAWRISVESCGRGGSDAPPCNLGRNADAPAQISRATDRNRTDNLRFTKPISPS